MYEFTMGGAWFRWELLDERSKRLAGASLVAAALAPAPLAGMFGYELGYSLASGTAQGGFAPPSWAVLWTLASLVVSGILWWRFSLRQDELFNRVQNWALAMGGAWSATLLSIWALLEIGGFVPPVAPVVILGLFYGLTLIFWFRAVRRWV